MAGMALVLVSITVRVICGLGASPKGLSCVKTWAGPPGHGFAIRRNSSLGPSPCPLPLEYKGERLNAKNTPSAPPVPPLLNRFEFGSDTPADLRSGFRQARRTRAARPGVRGCARPG